MVTTLVVFIAGSQKVHKFGLQAQPAIFKIFK